MGIEALFSLSGNSTLEDIPPNLTNPICIGTSSLLAEAGSSVDALFGSNSSFPIPLDTKNTAASVASWCPWDLQVNPPYKPGDGVYPYPDDNIQRPIFDPCLSACAKTQSPSDCCTGSYDNPSVCGPNYYSTQAKGVCPDAYSYGRFLSPLGPFSSPYFSSFSTRYLPSFPSLISTDANAAKPSTIKLQPSSSPKVAASASSSVRGAAVPISWPRSAQNCGLLRPWARSRHSSWTSCRTPR